MSYIELWQDRPFLPVQLEGLRTYGGEECHATNNRKGQEKIS
jgi:hypothetical protein